MIPDKNVGFAIMMNSEDSGMLLGLTYELLDHYLDQPDFDWTTKWEDGYQARLAGGVEFLKQAKAGPSLKLAGYAGRYRDPWYGDVVIAAGSKGMSRDYTPPQHRDGLRDQDRQGLGAGTTRYESV